MKHKIVYVERKAGEFVSLEKAFREIAGGLSEDFETEFQQAPYGTRLKDTIRNLLFFRKRPADIYHITGHINYIALLFSPKNTVLSIMDIRFVHTPPSLRRYILKKLYLDLPVRRLRYVTAISNQIRDEIIEHTGCDPSKIRALDLPLLEHFEEPSGRGFNASKPVILQVGTMENKNIPKLAKALAGISCQLRIIGKMSSGQIRVVEENELDYVNLLNLSDVDMRSEYERADIIAFCSTYEGFGLPIIEGQAMRKPVITSDLSPMKETAGSGACLVDPFHHESIRAGVLKIIEDEKYREEIVDQGTENARRFEPTAVAKQYESLYHEILDRKKR